MYVNISYNLKLIGKSYFNIKNSLKISLRRTTTLNISALNVKTHSYKKQKLNTLHCCYVIHPTFIIGNYDISNETVNMNYRNSK